MKDYLSFEGLSHFFNNLFEKFSIIGHNHTVADISDLDNSLASFEDGSGNVTIECISINTSISSTIDSNGDVKIVCVSELKEYEDKLIELETKIESLTSIINDNDILIANNVSN